MFFQKNIHSYFFYVKGFKLSLVYCPEELCITLEDFITFFLLKSGNIRLNKCGISAEEWNEKFESINFKAHRISAVVTSFSLMNKDLLLLVDLVTIPLVAASVSVSQLFQYFSLSQSIVPVLQSQSVNCSSTSSTIIL